MTGESTYNEPAALRGPTPGTQTPALFACGEHATIRDSFPRRDWRGFEVWIASVPSDPLTGEYEARIFNSRSDHRDISYLVGHSFKGLSFKIAGEHLARLGSGLDATSSPALAPAPAPAPAPSPGPAAAPPVAPAGVARAPGPAPALAPTPPPVRPAASWTRRPPARRLPTRAPARPAAARAQRKRARELQKGYDGLRHEDGSVCTGEELVAYTIALSEADVVPVPAPAQASKPAPAPAPNASDGAGVDATALRTPFWVSGVRDGRAPLSPAPVAVHMGGPAPKPQWRTHTRRGLPSMRSKQAPATQRGVAWPPAKILKFLKRRLF